jgi:argonaute-like protein implicated in RNA metabolism and viral defense
MTSVPEVPDQYDEVYSDMPTNTHMLKPISNCKHCDAKRFEHEPPGFCYRDGKIKLNELNVPNELMRLWSSNDANAKHFRNSIRFFNGHFSFTSLYCRLDSAIASMKTAAYTPSVHTARSIIT